MITVSQLQQIFEHQTELARKFHPIELVNGYTPPTWPVNIQLRHGQDRLRQFAWWTAEEIGEYLIALPEDQPEELADVLHFLVELCLNIGIVPEEVMIHQSYEVFDSEPTPPRIIEVFCKMVKGINLLKAKPWKQQPKPTNAVDFRYHISASLYELLRLFSFLNLDAYALYFNKKEINERRIQSGV